MISVGTATETVLVRKKGKVLSSLYRIGIKMEYPAYSINDSCTELEQVAHRHIEHRAGAVGRESLVH